MKTMSRNDCYCLSGRIVLTDNSIGDSHLCRIGRKVGYNHGLYGWNWSAYLIGEYLVVTSYRNQPRGRWLDWNQERGLDNCQTKEEAISYLDSIWDGLKER